MMNSDLFGLKEAFAEGNEVSSRGYRKLGLRANPFPPDGLAPDDNLLPPAPETIAKIKAFVGQFLRTRQYQGLIVLGTYGMGKTHTLKLIREQLQESGLPLKAVYLITPGYEPYQILRGILKELGQGEITKMLWNIVLEDLTADYHAAPDSFLHTFEPPLKSGRGRTASVSTDQAPLFRRKLFGAEALSDYRTFLDAFDNTRLSRDKLREYIVSVFSKRITDDLAITSEFASMLIYDQYKSYTSWENLTVSGSSKSLFKPEGEPTFLLALLAVLKANGIQYLVVLIDEFEGIPLMKRMTRREAIQYLYTLRMLIDRVWYKQPFAFVLASTTQAWETAKGELYEAVGDRIPEELTLPTLTDRAGRDLMVAYLVTARDDGAANDELAPFDDDFFSIVGSELRRTPRQLVRLCYQLIERAVERDVSRIDAAFLDELLPTIVPEPAEVK